MRAVRLVLVPSVLGLVLASCGSVAPDKRLSYANVQTLNPGVDGRWVLEEFPNATEVRRDEAGRLDRLSYAVTDPQGKPRSVTLWFDDREVLERKEYSGPLVRPPPMTSGVGSGPAGASAPPPPR